MNSTLPSNDRDKKQEIFSQRHREKRESTEKGFK